MGDDFCRVGGPYIPEGQMQCTLDVATPTSAPAITSYNGASCAKSADTVTYTLDDPTTSAPDDFNAVNDTFSCDGNEVSLTTLTDTAGNVYSTTARVPQPQGIATNPHNSAQNVRGVRDASLGPDGALTISVRQVRGGAIPER